jgi:two-component system cell cycle sensor histidine kinase PleC
MSHELRTPLNAIIGFSEMMTTQVFGSLGSDHYVEYAGDIQFSGKHLLAIVEGVRL